YNAAQTTGTTTVVQEPITDAVGTYWALAFSPYVPTHQLANIIGLQAALDAWQDTLVSGTNIKTVNGNSLLGSGDITLPLGEVNTASNVGTGAEVFKEKSGVDLKLRSIVAGDGISVKQGTNTIHIEHPGGGGGSIPNASSTVVGGIKVRLDGTTLYITNDGSDA